MCRYVGSLSDMWSLGVILFAMVCGYLPFEHESTSKLYQKILNGDYTAPDFISSQVRGTAVASRHWVHHLAGFFSPPSVRGDACHH